MPAGRDRARVVAPEGRPALVGATVEVGCDIGVGSAVGRDGPGLLVRTLIIFSCGRIDVHTNLFLA